MNEPRFNPVTRYTAHGKIVTTRQWVRDGLLIVADIYQAITSGEQIDGPVGYWLTLREATLNSEQILDPVRSQALADEAGIGNPPRLSEVGGIILPSEPSQRAPRDRPHAEPEDGSDG